MKKYIILLSIFISILSGCSNTYKPDESKIYQKEIDEIYVYHSEFGLRSPEYKIDLKNRKLWEYTYAGDFSESELGNRDSSLKNEGFTFVCELDQREIDNFILKSARLGFTLWNETYSNDNIEDGHHWGITINYFDSTQSVITGSNNYPETWDEMLSTFEQLTDHNILLLNSDWMK